MDDLPLIWMLPIATFIIVVGVALWSRKRTEETHHDTPEEKSSLAKDGHGPNPVGPNCDT